MYITSLALTITTIFAPFDKRQVFQKFSISKMYFNIAHYHEQLASVIIHFCIHFLNKRSTRTILYEIWCYFQIYKSLVNRMYCYIRKTIPINPVPRFTKSEWTKKLFNHKQKKKNQQTGCSLASSTEHPFQLGSISSCFGSPVVVVLSTNEPFSLVVWGNEHGLTKWLEIEPTLSAQT